MKTKLKKGDVIDLITGHKVYADVPKHFVYSNCKGDFSLTHSAVVIAGEFDHLAGCYVVYKTAQDGGGTGHGPHDVYPSGHHVWCEKVDNAAVKVDFYQSGCFTAMIEEIEPTGRAERRWVYSANVDADASPPLTPQDHAQS
jgi:hypothetical protein